MAFTNWLKGAAERSGKTVAQTLATGLLAVDVATLNDFKPIRNALIVAISAGVASLITSAGSIPLSKHLNFWQNSLMRAVLTFAQTLAGVVAAAHPFNLLTFHWPAAVATSGAAALASVLTSLASVGHGDASTPSLVAGVR